jgi:hypothetical protein
MDCGFYVVAPIARLRLRVARDSSCLRRSVDIARIYKRTYLSVENFSQHTIFLPFARARMTKIERIDVKVIRAHRRSGVKVALNLQPFFEFRQCAHAPRRIFFSRIEVAFEYGPAN